MAIRCSCLSISIARRCASHRRAGAVASAVRAPSSSSTDLPSSAAVESAPSAQHQHHPSRRRLPIGAFYDLDDIAPKTHRRSDVREFVAPLIEFGRRINGHLNPNDEIAGLMGRLKIRAEAFGNPSTRSHRSPDEKEHDLSQREYIPPTSAGGVAQTGYDEKGALRCGICGAKMTLTREEMKAGKTPEDKLRKHINKMHGREQAQRLARINRLRKRRGKEERPSDKEMDMIRKYEAAMAGMNAFELAASKKTGKAKEWPRDDLLRPLREAGVRVRPEADADKALIRSVGKWMKIFKLSHSQPDGECKESRGISGIAGVLVVYSRGGDFGALFESARGRGFITVSATDKGNQTRQLASCSDIIIGPLDLQPWESDGVLGGLGEDAASVPSSLSFDQGNGCDEHEDRDVREEDEGSVIIRDVPSSPMGMFSSLAATPSRHETTIRAIPYTDRGLKFMRDVQSGSISNGGDDHGKNSWESWDLYVPKASDGPDESATSEEKRILPASQGDEPRKDAGESDAERRLSCASENAGGKEYASFPATSTKRRRRQHLPGLHGSNYSENYMTKGSKEEDSAGKGAKSTAVPAAPTIDENGIITLGTKLARKLRKGERSKLKRRDLIAYECKGCGDQIRHWVQFIAHMKRCENCGKAKARRIAQANKRRSFEVFFEEDRTLAYECGECGDRAGHFVDLIDRVRGCEREGCGRAKARRMRKDGKRKTFQVSVEPPADGGGCATAAVEPDARRELGM